MFPILFLLKADHTQALSITSISKSKILSCFSDDKLFDQSSFSLFALNGGSSLHSGQGVALFYRGSSELGKIHRVLIDFHS